jgi:hypothetical protein
VCPGFVLCLGHMFFGCRLLRSTVSISRVAILFNVCGDTGSLAPLSGMTKMTYLDLDSNQLTGVYAILLCFERIMVDS